MGDPAADLAADLAAAVRGQVRFDAGSRALYSTDASNYRQVPIGVVLPLDAEDVEAAVEVCRRHGAPLLPRGAGTSTAGQACNVAVVLDFSRHMRRLLALDPERRLARVEPGMVLDDLRAAALRHGLTFGPDPATHDRCTLGGMIGNNSCGVHSVMAGKTVDNVEELEVLTYDGARLTVGKTSEEELAAIVRAGGRRGEIYARLAALRDRTAAEVRARFPPIPRRVSGYNLDELLPESGFHVARALVGSEGTCATVLAATLRLVPSPPARTLLVLGFPDVYAAADRVPEVMAHGPIGLEGIDDVLASAVHTKGLFPVYEVLPPGGGWLLVEMAGQTREEADGRARDLAAALAGGGVRPEARIVSDPRQARMAWKVRESALGATARVPGRRDTWEGWEDAAVAPERLGEYLRAFRGLLARHGYGGALYGHFGQGCIHTRIDFDLATHEGVRAFRAFVEEAADLAVSFGGSLSGEHGDGQARAELLPRMFGPELVAAFRELKAIWDPAGRMNPGKVVDPRPLDADLRLGPDFRADFRPDFRGDLRERPPASFFGYPEEEGGGFARAATRCVGYASCIRESGGAMCPSYQATGEEMHSTRGRARLLFEMLQGEVVTGGLADEHVKESLDLCLACKACKGECPVRVDMATYKAEFLAHYYETHRRPRAAWAFGRVDLWARLASPVAGLANRAAGAPGLSALLKAAMGMAPERRVPALAGESFRSWFARRRPPQNRQGARPRVLLFPDTFHNYFQPGPARAAVEVLEAAGWQVVLPSRPLCCGRPLYDFGMLGLARRRLLDILHGLEGELAAGTPIVGLEPSCVAVFRDELPSLLAGDPRAARLAGRVRLLPELLEETGFSPPPLVPAGRRALVHAHCHQRAVLGLAAMQAEERLLARLGLEMEVPEVGCCGMAGAFGFERGERYRVSVACGERALLPAVRAAPPETLIVAGGFSCREQIAQGTGRLARHPAELVAMALRQGAAAAPSGVVPGTGESL